MPHREKKSEKQHKLSEEGQGLIVPGARTEIPLQPIEKIMVNQVVPLHSLEDLMPE